MSLNIINKVLVLTVALFATCACSKFSSSASGTINGSLTLPTCPNAGSSGLCQICGSQATLKWTPVTTDTTGAPLVINGYDMYYGTSPVTLDTPVNVNNPASVTGAITNLAANTYYFAVKAYYVDANGTKISSAYSNIFAAEMKACANASVDLQTGRIFYTSIPPKIIDTRLTGSAPGL